MASSQFSDSSYALGGGPRETQAALDGADCATLMTEWPEYAALPPAVFAERMARPLVLDGRRALDAKALRDAGIEYRAIGLGGSE